MREIKIFSPATVANISCGFDILGLCLDTVGDEMVVREVAGEGFIIKPSVGFNYKLNSRLAFRSTAGYIKAIGGALSSASISMGISYRMSLLTTK